MQVYNLSQNVQEDDLQHLQVRPSSLPLCSAGLPGLHSALADCVALERHFCIRSHKRVSQLSYWFMGMEEQSPGLKPVLPTLS